MPRITSPFLVLAAAAMAAAAAGGALQAGAADSARPAPGGEYPLRFPSPPSAAAGPGAAGAEDGVAVSRGALAAAPAGRAAAGPEGDSARPPGGGPVLSVGDTRVVEGDSGTTRLVFPITLSSPAPRRLFVSYSIVPGTAKAGRDYVAPMGSPSLYVGTLSFGPGETRILHAFEVLGDETVERNEELHLAVSGPPGSSLGMDTGTGTIVNDDGPTLSARGGGVAEGDSGDRTPLPFVVSLSEPSEREVEVVYRFDDGTALGSRHYLGPPGRFTFPPGRTERVVNAVVLGEDGRGADRAFFLRLLDGSDVSVSAPLATGLIWDDDSPASLFTGPGEPAFYNPW